MTSKTLLGSPLHVALWDAINQVVASSGGRNDRTSEARQLAVCEVEIALRALTQSREAPVRLFQVQDNERPMYLVATDWAQALDGWRRIIAAENDGEVIEPQGITLVCDSDELVLLDHDPAPSQSSTTADAGQLDRLEQQVLELEDQLAQAKTRAECAEKELRDIYDCPAKAPAPQAPTPPEVPAVPVSEDVDEGPFF